jgi:hypothetical protein
MALVTRLSKGIGSDILPAYGGCSGQIRMRAWAPMDLKAALEKKSDTGAPGNGIEGVFVYYTRTLLEVDSLQQLLDKDGKPILEKDGKPIECEPVMIKKLVTLTDYEHPYQIYYVHGLLDQVPSVYS